MCTSSVLSSNDNVVKSPFPELNIPKVPLDEYIWTDLNKFGNKPAAVSVFDINLFVFFDSRNNFIIEINFIIRCDLFVRFVYLWCFVSNAIFKCVYFV